MKYLLVVNDADLWL